MKNFLTEIEKEASEIGFEASDWALNAAYMIAKMKEQIKDTEQMINANHGMIELIDARLSGDHSAGSVELFN